jgi:hypothetical protein
MKGAIPAPALFRLDPERADLAGAPEEFSGRE